MNYKLFIAGRFLFSKGESKFISFITYISIIGVTLGVAALIIAVSVLNGFEKRSRIKWQVSFRIFRSHHFSPKVCRIIKK
ncbi:MAG: hypothetical protein IPM96_16645 [Ignavibacteria bacterium]|nr:hypothetical protein [Ignavibacteria bacterium]